MDALKRIKNTYTALTIGLIIVGLVLLIWPDIGLGIICKIFGIFLLIFGATKLVGYFSKDIYQLAFQFDLGLGIVALILGVIMTFKTGPVIEFVAICIGIFLLVDAALKMQTAHDAKKFGLSKWWTILLFAIIVVIVGILLLFSPFKTTSVIVRIIGLSLLCDGVMNLVVVRSTVNTIKRNTEEVIDAEYIDK